MRIRILDDAEQDLIEGFAFYAQQEAGLGDYFLDSLYADIDSLQLYAGIHSKHFGKFRMLAKTFPFAIYYTMEDQTVTIHAILGQRRNPHWIQERLGQ